MRTREVGGGRSPVERATLGPGKGLRRPGEVFRPVSLGGKRIVFCSEKWLRDVLKSREGVPSMFWLQMRALRQIKGNYVFLRFMLVMREAACADRIVSRCPACPQRNPACAQMAHCLFISRPEEPPLDLLPFIGNLPSYLQDLLWVYHFVF